MRSTFCTLGYISHTHSRNHNYKPTISLLTICTSGVFTSLLPRSIIIDKSAWRSGKSWTITLGYPYDMLRLGRFGLLQLHLSYFFFLALLDRIRMGKAPVMDECI